MKKLLLLLSFILFSILLPAQNYCGVDANYTAEQRQKFFKLHGKTINSKSLVVNPSPSNIQSIPLSIYFVRETNGNFSVNKSIEPFYKSLIETNRIYSQMGIQFYVENFTYLDNSAWLKPTRGDANHTALLQNKTANTVNVWINDGWSGPGAAATATGYGGVSGVELLDISEATVPHEFGHFLTLAHTFDTSAGVELVNGSNCATAGDKICDTPADPGVGGITITNCVNASNTTDPNGDLYNPPVANIMSYYGGFCGFEFTPGQYSAMIAGFEQWHTGYIGNGQITTVPTGLAIANNGGYDELSWTNAANQVGTQIEYSLDGGTSWNVMLGTPASENTVILSDVLAGTNYKIRARHLNSKTYSAVSDYAPAVSHPLKPYVVHRDEDVLPGIGEFSLANTAINNTSNLNNVFTVNTYTTTPELFIGGSYDATMKIMTNNLNQGGNAFFLVYLDENGDGDFDDAGELKFQNPDNNLQFTVNTTIDVGPNATAGFTRLRVRCTSQNSTESPTDFYNFSETEDYVVKLVAEQAPQNLMATFNNTTKEVDLNWTDALDSYPFIVERSIDGINFIEIDKTADGTVNTFSDTMAPPNTQVEYRVKKESGSVYSESVIINTPDYSSNYCPPSSASGCGNTYGISKIAIASINFEHVSTNADCGTTDNDGYSDYYSTPAINLVAGNSYTIARENQGFGTVGYFQVYLDTNQDGTFSDLGGNFEQATININIPSDAVNGETRIRFRSYFNPISGACDSAAFGETEDYKVVITGGKESTVINAMAGNAADTSLDLSWDIASGANPTGFQINVSTDGINFTPLATLGASDRSYTANGLTLGTKYFFEIIATGTQNSEAKLVWNSTTGSLSADSFDTNAIAKVFPNPTNDGKVFITTKQAINSIKVFDIRGVLLKNIKHIKPNSQGAYTIDQLAHGFNILMINIDGTTIVRKIMVR
ncbi:Por secretion system C-terminal sorting domain-containing protein [Hyunsoonleella jejuensis]|uniref:Por secretion system C-terminal sorting domain-containing protein n=1 Tax=Hyunsoonleella jejuensis TaxID=419940 RepID=A0A1H9B7S8_9FLAO|nr:GEVED domain-containing protein [Hyunsoonleella jejuensis]SEP84875.1 Por secretion system C-terminal sorting domain-containing protein [Hyunsoonleella jejuensis]